MKTTVTKSSGFARVRAGDAEIASVVSGEPGRPWVILSGSLAADRSMWDGQIDTLSRSYRVLSYDTRGHGDSSAPEGPYSFEDLATDVLVLMDHYEIKQAGFVGLSLGGMTGMKLMLEFPGRFWRFVCCDARATVPVVAHAAWDQRSAMARADGMSSIVQDTLERWVTPSTRHNQPGVVDAIVRMIRRTSVEGYAGCIGAIKTAAFLARLKDMTVPTTYVVGADDTGVPPEVMKEMADTTPGSAYQVIAGAAHLSNLDQPEAFDNIMLDALKGI